MTPVAADLLPILVSRAVAGEVRVDFEALATPSESCAASCVEHVHGTAATAQAILRGVVVNDIGPGSNPGWSAASDSVTLAPDGVQSRGPWFLAPTHATATVEFRIFEVEPSHFVVQHTAAPILGVLD